MRGFSLIELMVTLGIVGILAALAMPGYSQVMNRALRQDARLALLRVQQRQEIFFASNLTYSRELGAPAPVGLGISTLSDNGNYLLELHTSTNGMGYTISAHINPEGRQTSDRQCAWLTIDESGKRRSATADSDWHDDDPNRCWG